jgi:hypothetical protein
MEENIVNKDLLLGKMANKCLMFKKRYFIPFMFQIN